MMGCLFALFIGCSPRLAHRAELGEMSCRIFRNQLAKRRPVRFPRVLGGAVPQHGERGVGKKRYRSVDTGDDLPTDRTKGAERPTDRASTEGRLVPALFSAAYRR